MSGAPFRLDRRPSEIADADCFLASEEPGAVTDGLQLTPLPETWCRSAMVRRGSIRNSEERSSSESLPEWKTERVNAGSTGCRKSTRWPVSRFGSTMLPGELTREHANPVASTFNPKVAGSIPARPITDIAQTTHAVCRVTRAQPSQATAISRASQI
jgi:hypothetical protein